MSAKFYGKFWIATKDDINDVILREKVLPFMEPTTDQSFAHRIVASLYARYIILCNNLSDIYDQTLQVQKREVIEKLLISITNRLFEWQREMMAIEMSEFIYVDDALMELKLIPQEILFLKPFHFPLKREKPTQDVIDAPDKPKVLEDEKTAEDEDFQNFDLLASLMGKSKEPEETFDMSTLERFDENEGVDDPMSFLEAVNIIKSHEKARQTRVFLLNLKMHPDRYQIEVRKRPEVKFDFCFGPEDAPIRQPKVVYKKNFYQEIIDFDRVTFYEKPTYVMTKRGLRKVVKPKPVIEQEQHEEIVEEVASVESLLKAQLKEKLEREETERINRENQEIDRQRNAAAKIIQTAFLAYKKRKQTDGLMRHKLHLYGMIEDADVTIADTKIQNREYREKRRQRKSEFDEKLRQAILDEKAKILKLRSPFIMEDISDHIRAWFKEFYYGAEDFPRYPEEFEGGTILLVRGETPTLEEFIIEKRKTKEQKEKEKEQKKLMKEVEKAMAVKDAERLKRLEEMAKKKEASQGGKTFNFAHPKYQSQNFVDLSKTMEDYEQEWQFVDESDENPNQQSISLENYAQIHQELRPIVDEFMRIELEMLKKKLAKDKKKKYRKPKPKKPKSQRKRKPGKLEIDVTRDRSLEECYEELKSMNIIRIYTRRTLDDFIADSNYAAYELRLHYNYPSPSYAEIKNQIQSFVLGMGSVTLPKPKSLCIAGPPKCGKKLLIDALCSQFDAVVFDLSADKIEPIGDMKYFVNLVVQMAKKLQPSVLYINGAHKSFIRKMTPDDRKLKPKKLGKYLFKYIMKAIAPEDRVMLLGSSNEPWNCQAGKFKKCYEKIVVFPPVLDYNTCFLVWRKALMEKNIFDYDVSNIAYMTVNFSAADILETIDNQLNLRRRLCLFKCPLSNHELFSFFQTGAVKPIGDDIIKKFESFARKLDKFKKERNEYCDKMLVEVEKENRVKEKTRENLQKARKAKENKLKSS